MTASTLRTTACFLAIALTSGRASAIDPRAWFEAAARYDLSGEGSAPLAFAWYRRAAEAGLPEAEFNVAVMLDSGRGVAQDAREAAVWYAKSAAHGDRRAAYNAGQLYAEGQGVPRNAAMAHAWFAASNLPAARERIDADVAAEQGGRLTAPQPVAPGAGASLGSRDVEFVWTVAAQPESVRFYVEMRSLDQPHSPARFETFSDVSSTLAPAPPNGHYAWRVFTIAQRSGHYVTSEWTPFSVDPDRDATPRGPVTSTRATSITR